MQALEKYTNILKEKDYFFTVYNFNREKIELKKILINEGKKKNGEINERLNCYICKHSCKYYKKEDIYLRAMVELQRKGYNEIADWYYRNLMIDNYCVIEGYINSKSEIIIKNISAI